METTRIETTMNEEQAASINHALRVLDEAAQDSSEEIRAMINRDYNRIRELMGEVKPEMKRALREIRVASAETVSRAKDRLMDTTRDAARRVDETAHERPWPFIGSTALAGLIFGYFLGRRSGSE